MQAIILAAGMGKRLKHLTENNTKCMVKVNGIPLIDRMLKQIEKQHLSRIVIVVGFEGQKLIDHITGLNVQTPIIFVNNGVYDKTNNIYSLSLASDWLCKEDTILFESDLIFEDSILEELINDQRETLALVDKYESWMDGTCMKLDNEDNILEFVPGSKFQYSESKDYYKTVNIYKFSQHFSITHYIPFLEAYIKALGNNEYYEQVLRVITMLDFPEIKAKRLHGQKWYEIDDVQDLDIASSLFTTNHNEKIDLMEKRYGGYWRYPELLDFCYLVNPYFPPQKLMDEIKASFDRLITQYPSGMGINALLASRNFGVLEQNIIVGNGAAELIKALMERLIKKIGFVRPTFEEYSNRYDESNSIIYTPSNMDYRYDENDLIKYFDDKDISSLVIVNPDNPSGNYITYKGLQKLIEWGKNKRIRLIIDESFIDFSDEEKTLIEQNILDKNPHLYVMRSISKSYGVPGLRLGVLASGDIDTIAHLKKTVSIWNINSFAEFYMQIEEKYRKDYKESLVKIKKERERFLKELSELSILRIIPTQANYVMVETIGISSREFAKQLLINDNILIKDLSKKIYGKNYTRIAIRNKKDNDRLITAIKRNFG